VKKEEEEEEEEEGEGLFKANAVTRRGKRAARLYTVHCIMPGYMSNPPHDQFRDQSF